MTTSRQMLGAVAVTGWVVASFLFGREVEKASLFPEERSAAEPTPAVEAERPPEKKYQQLALREILNLPFSAFYEALRGAPREARQQWAAELESIPKGPRRTAAFSAYYKLLAQFDPREAINAIATIKDRALQREAFETVCNAAPPFAMRELAEFAATLADEEDGYPRGYLEVMRQWSSLDPVAAGRFVDQRPGEHNNGAYGEIVFNLAAVDPEAAMTWMQQHKFPAHVDLTRDFMTGLFCHDRAAAIAFASANADDAAWRGAAVSLFGGLYTMGAKEEAKAFFETLPSDDAKRAALEELQWVAEVGTAEEIGLPDRTPRGVAEWVMQFSPAYWQDQLSPILKRWSQTSTQEVVDWIVSQPAEARDVVADQFATDDSLRLEEALRPVFAVADERLRDRLLTAMSDHWDVLPEYAREQIAEAALLPHEKRRLLELVERAETLAAAQGSEK